MLSFGDKEGDVFPVLFFTFILDGSRISKGLELIGTHQLPVYADVTNFLE
jgi:hypothetical protein